MPDLPISLFWKAIPEIPNFITTSESLEIDVMGRVNPQCVVVSGFTILLTGSLVGCGSRQDFLFCRLFFLFLSQNLCSFY
jgi:hypothetical protein